MSDDAHVLSAQPLAIEVALGGEPLQVRPLTLGQVPGFSRAVREVLPAFSRVLAALEAGDGEAGAAADKALFAALLDAFADQGAGFINALAEATGVGRERLAAADIGEAVHITKAVVEVNRNFFDERIKPHLDSLRGEGRDGAGPTSSPSS